MKFKRRSILCAVLFAFFVVAFPIFAHGGIIDDLQGQIAGRTQEILKLEEEIRLYQEELDRTTKQAESLDNALRVLELSDKKLSTDIRVTEKKITSAIDAIIALKFDIDITTARINDNSAALKKALHDRYKLESYTLVEILLAHTSFSSFWSFVAHLERFQKNVEARVEELKKLNAGLTEKERRMTDEKANFVAYKNRLLDQKEIVEFNKDTKAQLLSATRSKETQYEEMLRERMEKKEALEREIAEFEERLRVEIDPASLPETGTGALVWPLDVVSITQYFGNTPFASANPQVYSGMGHNGIDLRGAIGTPVKASANGVVVETGNTDEQCYKVSYGKWVLVRHYNGLSTLYAHLSLIKVHLGDDVARGDIIGYSGNSGYSTGPHLHFGVFASAAVSVSAATGPNKYVSKICGTYLKLPLSAKNGYLNPLSYLPKNNE